MSTREGRGFIGGFDSTYEGLKPRQERQGFWQYL